MNENRELELKLQHLKEWRRMHAGPGAELRARLAVHGVQAQLSDCMHALDLLDGGLIISKLYRMVDVADVENQIRVRMARLADGELILAKMPLEDDAFATVCVGG